MDRAQSPTQNTVMAIYARMSTVKLSFVGIKKTAVLTAASTGENGLWLLGVHTKQKWSQHGRPGVLKENVGYGE